MEQCTLDAIGVLIISTAAGGGVLGLKTWYLVFQVQVHLSYASVYLDLDSGYLSGVGQVHLPPLWYLYYKSGRSPGSFRIEKICGTALVGCFAVFKVLKPSPSLADLQFDLFQIFYILGELGCLF